MTDAPSAGWKGVYVSMGVATDQHETPADDPVKTGEARSAGTRPVLNTEPTTEPCQQTKLTP